MCKSSWLWEKFPSLYAALSSSDQGIWYMGHRTNIYTIWVHKCSFGKPFLSWESAFCYLFDNYVSYFRTMACGIPYNGCDIQGGCFLFWGSQSTVALPPCVCRRLEAWEMCQWVCMVLWNSHQGMRPMWQWVARDIKACEIQSHEQLLVLIPLAKFGCNS